MGRALRRAHNVPADRRLNHRAVKKTDNPGVLNIHCVRQTHRWKKKAKWKSGFLLTFSLFKFHIQPISSSANDAIVRLKNKLYLLYLPLIKE